MSENLIVFFILFNVNSAFTIKLFALIRAGSRANFLSRTDVK